MPRQCHIDALDNNCSINLSLVTRRSCALFQPSLASELLLFMLTLSLTPHHLLELNALSVLELLEVSSLLIARMPLRTSIFQSLRVLVVVVSTVYALH